MNDVNIIAWKEWRELLRAGGTRASALFRHVFSIAVIGVIWPWQFGAAFMSMNLAVALATITAMIYIAGAAPDTFAGERERHTLETLLASRLSDRAILAGKILALIQYGCVAAVIMLLFGLITVNIVHRQDELQWYPLSALLGIALFTPVTAGLTAAVGIHVSLRAKTVKQAQQTLSTAMLILLFVPAIAIPSVPQSWRTAMLQIIQAENRWQIAGGLISVMILIQALLFVIADLRFRRGKMLL